ncbi:MAG: DNA adenine methylase, partial [Myxococcota bacterium]
MTVHHTEGIKYAGSKKALIPQILALVDRTGARTVFDAFSGTTRVSQALARSGHHVIANDLAVWSRTFAVCYLQNTRDDQYFQALIDHLNALPGVDGWFTENYGGGSSNGSSVQPDGLKRPWQVHNTRKLDAIRPEIDRLGLPDCEKCVLLTSLILALDEVDSTLGHFVSYLKDWSPRSGRSMMLR